MFSGRNSSLDDRSCHILRENGEGSAVVPAEVVSSMVLPAATGSEHEVVGNISPTEQPETSDFDTASKKGLKRTREIEPMDHSGIGILSL